jgi:hypothetical protein
MYRVTVAGVSKEWTSLDFALRDALTRGFGSEWTIEKVVPS